MNTPVVTVFVPTHRRPRQLFACLEALALQAFREPWDAVVIDDGSPDALVGLPERFAGRLDLRVIHQENAGPAAARNRGVAEARSEYVAFTDDDCRPEPAWLETLVRSARERPGSLVGGATWNGLDDDIFACTSQLIIDMVYEHFNADTDQAYFLASNNMLCPRDRFLEIGGFDGSFPRAGAEDREFCDRWRVAGWPIVWRPAARVEHRHPQTFRGFLDLHYRYGRGAHLYQSKRRERRSGTMREDLQFHRSLIRRVAGRLRDCGSVTRRARLLIGLVVWQVANAAGFAAEALAARCGRRS